MGVPRRLRRKFAPASWEHERMPDLDPNDWLPSHAEYMRERTAQEAERGIRWTKRLGDVARRKLTIVYDGHFGAPGSENLAAELDEACVRLLARHSRLEVMADGIGEALRQSYVDSDEAVEWLAAVPLALPAVTASWYPDGIEDHDYVPLILQDSSVFYAEINDVLLEERVEWLYLHDRLRPREAQPLYLAVIQPVEALLSADPRFEAAERAYGEAVNHLAQGNHGSAVSLTYSAVQETLQALGARGNDLGQLFADAKNRGFLLSADAQLLNMIKGLTSWQTANRSARGNAHGASSAQAADAQLAIHVAAALMVRLMQFSEA